LVKPRGYRPLVEQMRDFGHSSAAGKVPGILALSESGTGGGKFANAVVKWNKLQRCAIGTRTWRPRGRSLACGRVDGWAVRGSDGSPMRRHGGSAAEGRRGGT